MARQRFTEEERVVRFFETSDLSAASAVFNVAKGVMKKRLEAEETFVAPVKKRKRVKRAPAAESETATA